MTGQTAWSSFSYPFGDVTLAAKKIAGARFATCRSTIKGVNQGNIDLAALRSEFLSSRLNPMKRAYSQIAEVVRRRGWLIFCMHDVAPTPSPIGCTPEQLESAVAAALAADCDVVTVEEAYRRLSTPAREVCSEQF